MNHSKSGGSASWSGLVATLDLMWPYRRRAVLLAAGICLTAVVDAIGIGLSFPMFVSLLQDGQPENVGGLAEGFLAQIRETFPNFSTNGIFVGLFLAVTSIQAALHILIRRAIAQFQWRARHDWATSMMQACLADDRVRQSERKVGEQLERMFVQTQLASNCLCQMIQLFACLLNLLVLYVLICLIHWQLAVAYLLGTIVLAGATRPFWSKWAVNLGTKRVASNQKSYTIATENLMAARDIQAFGIERERTALFARQLDEAHRVAVQQSFLQSLSDPLGLILLSSSAILIVITSRWVYPGEPGLVVPLVGFALMAVRRLQTLTLGLASHVVSVAGLLPSATFVRRAPGWRSDPPRAAELAGSPDSSVANPDGAVAQTVVAKNLCFSYPGKPPLFDQVSCTIPAQQVTLLAGRSGDGKSTLADLLMGNLTRGSGEIRWGNTDICELKPGELRSRVGYVSQESFLFNMSIRDNLLIARPNALDAELIDACRLARAWQFIEELPAGLDTIIGERGLTLSAGQRQRLAIARVLVRDPPFLIFDEATNSLDSTNSMLVWQAIDAIRTHKTILVITHQLDSTVRPDVVLRLRDRRIATLNSVSALSNVDSIIEVRDGARRCA